MIQISEPEDSESLNKNNPVIHYRFNRKFEFLNCTSQLFISDSKLKIIVNCYEEYSKEKKSYQNSFSINELQYINKYYTIFNKIEEVLEDTASVFNQGNYDIERSGNKLYLILHLNVNEDLIDVKFQLNKIKNNENDDIKKKKKKVILNSRPNKHEDIENYQGTKSSNINKGVKSMNELNNLLTDLKDRLTVLEVKQNMSHNQPRNDMNRNFYINKNNRNILNTGNNSYPGIMNENILLNMESILKRIDRLEQENHKKNEKITNLLKEKIKVYEPTITATSDNDSVNDNNKFYFNNNNYNNLNNNINDYNYNNGNINPNLNYIDLGSIKDTSTITSTNSFMKTGLWEIKEELNNPSPKEKINKKKKEKKLSSEDSYGNNKVDTELNTLSKNLKEKEKEKSKKNPNKSKKKVHKKDINEFPNTKKKKGNLKENKDIINNRKEEILNTDINNNNNKKKLVKSLSNMNIYDSQKLNNKFEKDITQKKSGLRKNNSVINPKTNKNFEINNKNNIKEENNIYFKQSMESNKDNNEEVNNSLNNYDIINNNNFNNKNQNNNFNINNNSDSSDENNNLNINKINNKMNNNNINNNINKKISSSNPKDESSVKVNIKVNQMLQNSNSSSQNSENENEQKIQNIIQRNKEKELEREIEAKEERKRRQKTFQETSSGDSSLKVKQIHKSLTMAPKEDIRLYCKSHIIFTKDELRLLKKKLNYDKNLYSVFFDVMYRASEDGDNVEIAKKVMQKEKKTLTLFETEKGARFGIYVEKKLDTSILMNKYLAERPGTSFLVSLNNLEIYDIYKKYVSSEHKLCFIKNKKKNRNESSYAIYTPPNNFLGANCYMGDLTAFFMVDGNEDIIGEKEEYKLKEVEICKVSIEKKEDQEKLKNANLRKSKTEMPKKGNNNKKETKYSYGKEYSFQNQENSSQDDYKGSSEENKNLEYNKVDAEKIKNKLNLDYYDFGIIKGSEDQV